MTNAPSRTARNATTSRGSFRLFPYFVLISVGAMMGILLLVGFGLRALLYRQAIEEAERDAVNLTAAIRDLEADVLVHTGPEGHPTLALDDEHIPDLDWRMRGFLHQFGIVKIKIFDRRTRIIYSTDPKIIGKLNPDNAKLAAALAGVAVSKFESKEHVWDMSGEEQLDIDLVETYVPVPDARGRTIGSFEIYKNVTEHVRAGRATLVRSVGVLGFALLLAFGVLGGLMYRAARIIHAHTHALEESRRRLRTLNEELEKRVKERTADLARTVDELEVAKDRAEAANRAKTEFLANVGHEFRTPLSSILGFSETMGRLVGHGKYDRLADCAKTVQETAEHLAHLVDQVMDISAIEAGRVELCLEEVSPAAVCRQVSAHCAAAAKAKGLTLEIDVSEQLPALRADRVRLTEVLTNLVGNAIKFTDHGRVSVTARELAEPCGTGVSAVDPPAGSRCHSVEFLVADTGPGIEQKDRERIFERFERLDTSGAKRGSGLGLAISRKLVESHGGRIWVESQPGAGSVFHLTIPVAHAATKDSRVPDAPSGAESPVSVAEGVHA